MNPPFPLLALCLFGLLAALWPTPAFCQAQKPQLVVQIGHTDDVRSVAFSRDDKLLASGSWDNTIKIWDVAIGELLRTFSGHDKAVMSVAFSPDRDSKTLASGSLDDTIRIWDVATGEKMHTIYAGEAVTSVAFSPDGTTLAGDSLVGTIGAWDVVTYKKSQTNSEHTDALSQVAFSRDGKIRVVGGNDAQHHTLWDTASGQKLPIQLSL